MRPLLALVPVTLLLLAGCIAPPEAEEDVRPSAVPPPAEDRIEGMTATEVKQDKKVDCGGNPGVCYERDLLVTGRIGESQLPVELLTSNGAVTLIAGVGDAWSLHAVYRVRGADDASARDGLDSAWRWTHEEGGKHVLKAGPTPIAVPINLPLLPAASSPTVQSARYEVVLPAWVVLDVLAESSNGPIALTGVRAGSIDVETSNGAIVLQAQVRDVKASTSNGAIEAVLVPTASGAYAFDTSNGRIDVTLVEDAAHGYDLKADTSNGRIEIELADGELREEKSHATFRTHRYDSRAIKTTVSLETSNGAITVTG